jgi:NAD(P)-dependent dehydrogenase (short-subunit alcohol dehydrogenase family)
MVGEYYSPSETKGVIKIMGKLQGKVALVTGGGSGIGRASALAFAREGAKVIIADVTVKGGQETVQMVKQAGGEAIFVKADVSVAAEVEELIKKGVGAYGSLDCAFNNAGINSPTWFKTAEYTEEVWDRIININLKGVWLCMKYEIPQMLRQGKGAIVNTSSSNGLVGAPGQSPYVASKHGVSGLTKAAALDYARAGIRVNAVCPGLTRTPMTEPHTDSEARAIAEEIALKVPIGRKGEPAEVAEAVVWLCSDAASLVTGHLLCVDGGLVIQ